MRSDAKASSVGPTMRRNSRFCVLALAASLLAIFLLATSAFASKEVVDYIGGESFSGSKGGEFNGPRDVAVNPAGAGPANAGDLYVVDESNNRIQRFDSDGDFISAWGADVIQAGKPGDQAATDPFEICTVAADCKAGVASGGNGATTGNGSLKGPRSIAVDGDTGNVYVSDGNFRINEYGGDGTFLRSFGFGVDETTAGGGYEVCSTADVCKAGITGSGAGQLGEIPFFIPGLGVAVSPPDGNASSGTVFLADTGNRRVSTYDLDGLNPSSFGSETQFDESQPRKVAVDSRGVVYASDSGNGAEIERYDSEDANGGGVGFLAPIAMPPLLEGPSESASSGLEVDPDSDGGGADEDVLYVLRGSWSSGAVVQQFGPVNDPGLTAAPAAVDDTHGAGASFGTFATFGLGLDDSSGRLFVSASFVSDENADRVYVLDNAAAAPGVSIDPVTSFDAHSATFSGSVDPNGVPVRYRFQYVDDAEFQANGFANPAQVPVAEVSVGKGQDPVAVEQQTPGNLIASTLYHVRLVAKQTFSSTQAIGGPVTFTTDGSGPSIDGTAVTVGTDEATLRGAIDSENETTNYHFEWGTTSAYGNSTPTGTLPAGAEPVAVEEGLSGLTPGQTYHYRLVATNATGTTQGPDQTFTTQAGPPQLPQRGYEIASQYPTGGVPVTGSVAFGQVASEDGNKIAIGSIAPMAQSILPPLPDDPFQEGKGGPLQYVFSRGADSWQNRTEVGLGGFGWSTNLERFVTTSLTQAPGSDFWAEDPRVSPDDQNASADLYQWQQDGKLTWISRDPRIPAGTPQTAVGDAELAGFAPPFTMSADGRTVVFKSQRQLLDVDTTLAERSRLYKWEDGQLHFIGIRPDGSVAEGGSSLDVGDDGETSVRYAVSTDGSRVIFRAQRTSGGDALYVQTDGQPTVEATKEEGVAPLPADQPYDVTYRGAAADGSRVFFTSASRLTPDSGAEERFSEGAVDLYVYDVATDQLRDLTPRLDGIDDPSIDPTGVRAEVLGVAASSEDGKRVYFVANGRYPTAPNPQGDLPSPGGRNLYLAELDGIDDPIELRFIATLGPEDSGDWTRSWIRDSGPDNINRGKTALASDDGLVFGFASMESLTGQPMGGTGQLFVYDAERGALDCPSCPSDGSLPADTVNRYSIGAGQSAADWQGYPGVKRWVSGDGSVFFNTATALLPADQNLVNDVYEFREGKLGLISSGTATTPSTFANATRDGRTVFLVTQEALVPQDKEPGMPKLYAARVGGGFPYVAPTPPCDFNAGACEGPASTAPATPGAGTAAFEGPGNARFPSKRACPKGKRKVRAKGKARCVSKHHHKRTAKNHRRASR